MSGSRNSEAHTIGFTMKLIFRLKKILHSFVYYVSVGLCVSICGYVCQSLCVYVYL